jgi:hypothetical protein
MPWDEAEELLAAYDASRGAAAPSAPAERAALRDRIAERLTAAAFECDGKCGLSEQDCYDAHPISFSVMSNGVTHVTGSVTEIAAAVLAVLPEPADADLRRQLAAAERIRENADFHLGQEMARRQLAEKETARLRAVVARLRQMTDHWEQQLPEVIRTPAVVSAIRAVLERAETAPSAPADRAALRQQIIDGLREARRPGLGAMTEAEALAHMADAVLRRMAGEAQQPETQAFVCKCPAEICHCGHHAAVSQPGKEPTS